MHLRVRRLAAKNILTKLMSCYFIILSHFSYADYEDSLGSGPYSVQVQFTGKYIEGTCTLAINNATDHESIKLPTLAVSTFTENGQEEGKTNFTVTLSNCPTVYNIVNLYFSDQSGYYDPVTGNLTNSDENGPNQIQIRIRDSNGSQMVVNNPDSNKSYDLTTMEKSMSFLFSASYYAKSIGNLTAGHVSTIAQIRLDYK